MTFLSDFLGKSYCKFYNKSYYKEDDNINGSRFPLDYKDRYIFIEALVFSS